MKNFKKFLAVALILTSFAGATIALADANDPIINFRNGDDTADTSSHIVGLNTAKYALFGDRLNAAGAASAYYLDPAWFSTTGASSGDGVNNYKITLDLGAFDYCNISDLCDHIAPSMSGKAGQILSNNGSSTYWTTAGTVSSITAGTGLSGGSITGTGTISMPNVGTAGTYGAVTTDAQGRVTAGKRMETYSGTTNGSGVYTVTFGTAYSVAPNIQANIIGASDTQNLRITSVSTTGFTVTARNRTDIAGLVPTFSNASSLAVDVLITEK